MQAGGFLNDSNDAGKEAKADAGKDAGNSVVEKEKAAPSVTEQIDAEKRKRSELMFQFGTLRGKLDYKQSEYDALVKLSELSGGAKSIGRLRRMKAEIEFKIATEAATLNAEKELIKKLNVINEEFEKALGAYRFKRKAELIAKDVAELKKRVEEIRVQVGEENTKIDALYARMRQSAAVAGSGAAVRKPRRTKEAEPLKISLEDIVTIKNKKEEKSDAGV